MENKQDFSESSLNLLIRTRLDMETDFSDGKKKRSFLWGKVLKTMKEKNPDFKMTREQISRKFVNLLTTYKRIKLRNSATGRDVSSWDFYEDFDQVYGTTPSILMPRKRLKLSLSYNDESNMSNYNSDASVQHIPTPKHTNEEEPTRPNLNILEKTVALLEGSQDDAQIYGKSWAAEFRQLDETQKLFAKRAIDEVLYQGRLRNLTSSSWHIQTQDNMEEY